MNKVYYLFEDGTKTYSLKEARDHMDETNISWQVCYEFTPMPVDACEGGNTKGKSYLEILNK